MDRGKISARGVKKLPTKRIANDTTDVDDSRRAGKATTCSHNRARHIECLERRLHVGLMLCSPLPPLLLLQRPSSSSQPYIYPSAVGAPSYRSSKSYKRYFIKAGRKAPRERPALSTTTTATSVPPSHAPRSSRHLNFIKGAKPDSGSGWSSSAVSIVLFIVATIHVIQL
jgi:hypothetical protein